MHAGSRRYISPPDLPHHTPRRLLRPNTCDLQIPSQSKPDLTLPYVVLNPEREREPESRQPASQPNGIEHET